MLTGNKELLNRYGALKKQVEDTKAEIDLRVKNKAVDNSGYQIIYSEEFKQYMIIDSDFTGEV